MGKLPPSRLEKQPKILDPEGAKELLAHRKDLDYTGILEGVDVLFLGERHNDYVIPRHIRENIEAFIQAGVRYFGIEMSPKDQELLDRINEGDRELIEQIDFSWNWGGPTNKRERRELIKALVDAKIKVVAVAGWVKPINAEESPEYTQERENQTAGIIFEYLDKGGKMICLLGEQHTIYTSRKPPSSYNYIKTAPDLLQEQKKEIKVKSLAFRGGMLPPAASYPSLPLRYFAIATRKLNLQDKTFLIDEPPELFKRAGWYVDGIIHIPEAEFE